MTSRLKKKERKLAKLAARALTTPGKQPKSMDTEDSPNGVIPEAKSPPQQIVAAPAAAKEKAAAVAARGAMPANRKVSRNEPCPCGSGKKFKHCHGKLT